MISDGVQFTLNPRAPGVGPTLDELQEVTTIVTHEGCPDGVASALLAVDALPNVRVVFVDYDTPAHRALVPSRGMMFVDMTPFAEKKGGALTRAGLENVLRFVDAGVWCLDHHPKQADIIAMFGARGIYADPDTRPGVSGATLAFEHVWAPLRAFLYDDRTDDLREMARVAGIRDTWQRDHLLFEAASEQAAALCFWPWPRLVDAMKQGDLASGSATDPLHVGVGAAVLAKQRDRSAALVAGAYRFVATAGARTLRVVAFAGEKHDVSEAADHVGDSADLVLAWVYFCEGDRKRKRITVHCRSRGAFDCGDFARALGGGGHAAASGFTIDVDAGSPDGSPYQHLVRLVQHHLWAARSTR